MTKPLDEDTQSHIPMLRPTAGLQRPFTSAQVNARGCAHGSWLGFFPAHGLTRPESPSMGQKLLPAIISTWSDWGVRHPSPWTRRHSPRRKHGGAKGNETGAGKPWRRSSGWAKNWNNRQGRNHHADDSAPVVSSTQGGGSGGFDERKKTTTASGGRLHAMRASDDAKPTWSRPAWRRRGTPDRTWWSSPAIGR